MKFNISKEWCQWAAELENNSEVGAGVQAGKIRKIADLPRVCNDFAHDPPGMIVLDNGVYQYECPGCRHITTFTVNKPTL